MMSHVNVVWRVAGKLKSISVVICDEEMALAILNGLLSSSEKLIIELDPLMDKDARSTYDFVQSRHVGEEQRCKMSNHKSATSYDCSDLMI